MQEVKLVPATTEAKAALERVIRIVTYTQQFMQIEKILKQQQSILEKALNIENKSEISQQIDQVLTDIGDKKKRQVLNVADFIDSLNQLEKLISTVKPEPERASDYQAVFSRNLNHMAIVNVADSVMHLNVENNPFIKSDGKKEDLAKIAELRENLTKSLGKAKSLVKEIQNNLINKTNPSLEELKNIKDVLFSPSILSQFESLKKAFEDPIGSGLIPSVNGTPSGAETVTQIPAEWRCKLQEWKDKLDKFKASFDKNKTQINGLLADFADITSRVQMIGLNTQFKKSVKQLEKFQDKIESRALIEVQYCHLYYAPFDSGSPESVITIDLKKDNFCFDGAPEKADNYLLKIGAGLLNTEQTTLSLIQITASNDPKPPLLAKRSASPLAKTNSPPRIRSKDEPASGITTAFGRMWRGTLSPTQTNKVNPGSPMMARKN